MTPNYISDQQADITKWDILTTCYEINDKSFRGHLDTQGN